MKVPKIRLINEWYEVDDYLHTDFMLDVDYHNEGFTDSHARWLDIPMDELEEYVIDSGLNVTYSDVWDYSSESVYQEYSEMSFDEWLDNYLDDAFVKEYIEYYIKQKGTPDITILV